MQDRFKFRFWHKPTKKLFDCYGFNESYVFGDTLDGIYTEVNPAAFDDCILMQCTGLKDKNGKLIYEGDIVFYKIGSNKCRDVVKWSDDRCSWVKGYQDLCTYKKYCEVIGNIYENPELLEVKSD